MRSKPRPLSTEDDLNDLYAKVNNNVHITEWMNAWICTKQAAFVNVWTFQQGCHLVASYFTKMGENERIDWNAGKLIWFKIIVLYLLKVNFSKKRKNRMRNDEAAIIALSKSRSQFLHKDTDSLVDNEAVIVYDERTAL